MVGTNQKEMVRLFFDIMLSLHNNVGDEAWFELKEIVACRLVNLSSYWNLPTNDIGILVESIRGVEGRRIARISVKKFSANKCVRYCVYEGTDEVRRL